MSDTSQSAPDHQVHHFQVARVALANVSVPLSANAAHDLGLAGLHCGSGQNLKSSCLNTDEAMFSDQHGNRSRRGAVAVVNDRFYYLQHDVTDAFPIEDGTFEWAYAEHLIEHIPLRQGVAFLREMHRLLKPGGFVRISTPDLARYAVGYVETMRDGNDGIEECTNAGQGQPGNCGAGFLEEHARRLEQMGLGHVPRRRAWLVNQIFYRWGHRWIYDFAELQFAAASAGFRPEDVRRCGFRAGRLGSVAAFDRPIRNDESLYVEITKT